MLQPLQLRDVAARYSTHIAELKDFLAKANCPIDSADSLSYVVARLQRDRGFHRDLSSHIWVVVYASDGQISYADLLGVVALAAAGAHFASMADENDAHDLLRFLMETRRSMDRAPEPKSEPAVYSQPIAPPVIVQPASVAPPPPIALPAVREPEAVVAPSEPETLIRLTEPPRTTYTSYIEAEPEEDNSRKKIIGVLAVSVFSALAIWGALHFSGHDSKTATAAVPAAPAAKVETPSSAPVAELMPQPSEETPVPAVAVPVPETKHNLHATPPQKVKIAVPAKAVATRPYIAPTTQQPSPASAQVTAASNTKPYQQAPAPVRTTPAPVTRTGPMAVFNMGSGAKPAPAEPDFTNMTRTRQAPQLLRRTPQEKADVLAENRPSAAVAIPSAPALPTPRGTVTFTSIGIYAENLIYSPTPAYPPAAAASNVQGEVKLQVDVAADGHVAAARVISGPPLLRDSALTAVQRWRYRPSYSGGKAVAMSTTELMQYRLQ